MKRLVNHQVRKAPFNGTVLREADEEAFVFLFPLPFGALCSSRVLTSANVTVGGEGTTRAIFLSDQMALRCPRLKVAVPQPPVLQFSAYNTVYAHLRTFSPPINLVLDHGGERREVTVIRNRQVWLDPLTKFYIPSLLR